MRLSNFFQSIFHSRNCARIFMVAVGAIYFVAPFLAWAFSEKNDEFLLLSLITILSVISIWMGARVKIFDKIFTNGSIKIRFSPQTFIASTWILFFIFILLTFTSASSIPIISALMGADANELSQQRGEFLKGREGIYSVLLYVNSFLVNTIVPYSIILLYERGSPKRHWAAFLFFIFCISFMQKALFVNVILPMLAFFAIKGVLRARVFVLFFVMSCIFLLIATSLSLQGGGGDVISNEDYISSRYLPNSSLDYFVWRSISVPIFTAVDTLIVHIQQFGGSPLFGATSSFLAGVFGMERVNIERYVFEYQFGSWNEIANSNAFFAVDAFVNFGWLGVFVFGLFVGQAFRWFRISQDVAFQSLWVLFAFSLFSASLIGTLLSNGFLFLFFYAFFFSVKKDKYKEKL